MNYKPIHCRVVAGFYYSGHSDFIKMCMNMCLMYEGYIHVHCTCGCSLLSSMQIEADNFGYEP